VVLQPTGAHAIDDAMLMGARPLATLRAAATSGGSAASSIGTTAVPAGSHTPATPVALPRALMLVHGYCSNGTPWPAANFTQPKIVFTDPNANRTHDQFAQLLRQFGAASSFGIVGHSQGGPAALHLYTYYTSGLDLAQGPRLIQSLAAPYQGTPLASLGGFTCGVNNDMTPAGAATWLAGIPSWARSRVWFYTTADAGSACNFFTNFVLSDPEDGTVERVRCDLPGATSMGHVTGWCHTTGMTYPANYTDASRNAVLNAQAAR
jgi:pimeloyl-ACP methyl ester carboxylesterase